MKRKTKKFLSWLLALSLLLSCAPFFSFAEPEEETQEEILGETGAEEDLEDATVLSSEQLAEMAEADMSLLKSMEPDNTTVPAEFEFIGETQKLALYAELDTASGNAGEFVVVNKDTGFVWRSNPIQKEYDTVAAANGYSIFELRSQIVLTWYREYNAHRNNTYKECVKPMADRYFREDTKTTSNGRVTIELLDGEVGFRVVYTLYANGISRLVIPVVYKIEGDSLIASIETTSPLARLTNTTIEPDSAGTTGSHVLKKTIDYNVAEIELLPFFGAAGANETGYSFIPDGSGAVIDFNNGKTVFEPYEAPIYGAFADTSGTYSKLSDNVCLPVFGMAKQDGDTQNAFVAIVTQNAGAGFIEAAVAGRDTAFNTVCSRMQNKIIESNVGVSRTQPASPSILSPNEDYTVKYCFLDGGQADYVGMAQRYRRYLTEENENEKLIRHDDATKSRLYIDAYAGVQRETSVAGVPVKLFDAMTTYEDLRSMVKDLHDADISDLSIKYSDWMKASQRLKVSSKVTYEPKLGGAKEFRKTADFMEENGVSFYPNVDFINYAKSGRGYTGFFDSAKSADKSPAFQRQKDNSHISLGSRWYLLKPNLVEKAAANYLTEYQKTDADSISLETIAARIYSDSSTGGVSRGESVNSWIRVIQMYRENGKKIMVTMPNAYVLPYADDIMGVPTSKSYVELADRAVPFYQILLRGYLPYSTESINLSSDIDMERLKAAETGSNLTFSFVYGDPSGLKETYLNYLYSCDYHTWRHDEQSNVVTMYTEHKKLMDSLEGAEIVSHRYINETLTETGFENGVRVLVNYDTEPQQSEGMTVPAMSYIVLQGGAEINE